MKCRECQYAVFMKMNGGPNRYHCGHKAATAGVGIGATLICRTKRGEEEMTIKTSPRWCPLKKQEKEEVAPF